MLVVFFGAFFVINLFLVVISDNYIAAREQAESELEQLEQQGLGDAVEVEVGHAPPAKSRWVEVASAAGRASERGKARLLESWPGFGPARKLCTSSVFEQLMVVLILCNTVVMGMEFYGTEASPGYVRALGDFNMVFTGFFLAELVVKLAGHGPVEYFSDSFNCFDFTIVLLSIVETALIIAGAGASVNLSVLRTFRIMRAFKLARSFKGLRLILKTIKDSLAQARDLSLLLVLCMFSPSSGWSFSPAPSAIASSSPQTASSPTRAPPASPVPTAAATRGKCPRRILTLSAAR